MARKNRAFFFVGFLLSESYPQGYIYHVRDTGAIILGSCSHRNATTQRHRPNLTILWN